MADTQVDAFTYVADLLRTYGLDLGDQVKSWMVDGITNSNALMQRVRTTDAYKTRFAAIIKQQQLGDTPMSEAEFLQYETSIKQQAKAAGMPPEMLTQERINELAVGRVSPSEFGNRALQGFADLNTQNQTVRDEFKRLGFTDGQAAAYFMDPTIAAPLLEKQLLAAKISGAAVDAGYGGLTTDQAMNIASKGITQGQASQVFGNLAQQEGMLSQSAGDGTAVSRDTALSATFDNNAAAQQQLARRRSEKQAKFQGGGNFTDPNKQGITGIGTNS